MGIAIEIKSDKDLLGPGAAPGTIPTDLEQATGLERFEILGKMQGIDVFDMRPLDASRIGKGIHPSSRTNMSDLRMICEYSNKMWVRNDDKNDTYYAWLSVISYLTRREMMHKRSRNIREISLLPRALFTGFNCLAIQTSLTYDQS